VLWITKQNCRLDDVTQRLLKSRIECVCCTGGLRKQRAVQLKGDSRVSAEEAASILLM